MANAMKNKDYKKKIIEQKRKLSQYTFFIEEMSKLTKDQIRKKISIVKQKKRNGISFNEVPILKGIEKSKNGNSPKSIGQNFSDLTKTLFLRQQKSKKELKK